MDLKVTSSHSEFLHVSLKKQSHMSVWVKSVPAPSGEYIVSLQSVPELPGHVPADLHPCLFWIPSVR